MTKNNKNFLNISLCLAAFSGILIFALKKWGHVEGAFGREANPFLVYTKAAHYFVTPILVFLIGTITHGHIKKYYESGMKKNRRTGLSNIITIIILVITGQSLLIIGSKDVKYFVEIIHLGTGSFFVFMAFYHQKK
ncbi:MAG: hypothetical protein HN576_13700 [Bacteriovoracaceae bacterium]|jgi:hypothetical protein|nr:hypothetical protein [Bacteriovoracaceae bacterium]